jgi:hypothetical protein
MSSVAQMNLRVYLFLASEDAGVEVFGPGTDALSCLTVPAWGHGFSPERKN